MWGLLAFEQMVEMELAAIDNMAKDTKCGKLPSVSVEAKTDENKKSVSDTKAVCAEEEKKTSASSRGRKSVKKDDKTSKDAVNCAKNTSGDEFPRIISLASGSRANCTLIDDGSTRILIDFGLSCRMLGDFLKNYGLLISDIDAVFITHEH